ncbi:MAG: hypothetical protein OXB92_05750 [Acidimicrobiaceae bacterium]|nr:hypothetical protein [Acidimicrobiia bacterium]MCY4493342.1 hypothetical protein [Acidimicrobiaceae bacterium]
MSRPAVPPDPSSVYDDDPTIGDDELLYRMVTRQNTSYGDDGTAQRGATNAFQDLPSDRLDRVGAPAVAVSVFLDSELRSNGLSADDLVQSWGPKYGVVSIHARDARNEDQGIVRWRVPDQPGHAMIFSLSGSKKTGGQSKRLAKASVVVIAPG